MEDKKKVIENYFEHGVLVSGDFLEKKLDNSISDNLIGKLEQERDLLVLNNVENNLTFSFYQKMNRKVKIQY